MIRDLVALRTLVAYQFWRKQTRSMVSSPSRRAAPVPHRIHLGQECSRRVPLFFIESRRPLNLSYGLTILQAERHVSQFP
ncbi:hypothetical protein [Paracoccus sp. MKU1]|uniref:hypothetical protein n=1 Tax=Paracoccus sp. MKU1 TaxID=1745182 RepID=UPI0007191155|nr:hypothetical protein [Paracoccus sp. MKU1]KRW97193.1 hypothetical protein AQY21_05055 [Paracoccus sp. MKU1]